MPISSGEILAIGGFDIYLTLYDVATKNVLDELYLNAGRNQEIAPVIDLNHLGIATQKGLHLIELVRPDLPTESWSLKPIASRLENETELSQSVNNPIILAA